ncbi:peptidase M1 [Echinicola marina]|uniref:M1 family metallopeptidase n=1 Tax=Echinicola marina TaxID=2859768 RepID=UPI001CF69B21|nr:M1 family aminopeptidase [Echinicola marina]UCS94595.1 peptidase M1 [Echinicola marina]
MNPIIPKFGVGLSLLSLLMACEPQNSEFTLEDGVSKNLAETRKELISEVKYTMDFDIPAEINKPIPAVLDLSFALGKKEDIFLDFSAATENLKSIQVNGVSVAIIHQLEHIQIPAENLNKGANQVHIEFIAGENSLNRNEEYLYSLLVPDRARSLFPCFDQPNIKASYQLNITAPRDWKVMCGAPKLSQIEKGNSIQHQFGETDKMSTYLFSFVAGKFNTAKENPGSFDMELFYRETDPEKVEGSVPQIFELHQKSISFLEDYTAFPFPFQKLDFAAIPIFQYGGMEHVGAIQYKEPSLFLDETATKSQVLGRAKLISHEVGHMWFGDLVTMDWFEDVWLKEVFANFMADKIVNPSFPDINHDLLFLVSHYPAAYAEDRTQGTNPIKQPLENLKYSGTLYGNIIYHKAPIMMRQLEALIGQEDFQEGIKAYMETFQYGNATWADLVGILDKRTAIDLDQWSEVWVNQSGRPIFKDNINYDEQGLISDFEISQYAEDGSDHFWPQVFDISLIYNDNVKVYTLDMRNSKVQLQEAIGAKKPQAIVYNSDGFGYGVFPVGEVELEFIPQLKDEVSRAQAYINSYENTLNGNLDPEGAVTVRLEGLKQEQNELLIRNISGQCSNLFWTYLSQEERNAVQPALLKVLFNRMETELPANIKKTLFGLYSSVAYSKDAKEQLYKIWSKETVIPNLNLNEDDYTELAMKLILFEHPKTEEIIKITKDAIINPDKLERFEFLLSALSADENQRDAKAAGFAQAVNREKEAWVSAALSFIHHPLRQNSGIKHLRASLDLLDEVQRTGDIFFPKAWLNSTIGRYSSPEAHRILNEFLDDNPDLNPVLWKKLMQASDDLVRVNS